MQTQYQLNVARQDKEIEFANNTDEFVEVVFVVDGKEVRNGVDFSKEIRGYCFPPGYRKNIKKNEK